MTSMLTGVLGAGPAVTVSAHVPDRHHFRGSFSGKDIIPLWRDSEGAAPNLPGGLLACLSDILGTPVSAPDLFAYTYGLLSAPACTATYAEELTLPPLRLAITCDAALFSQVAALGARLLWLHTYGDRFVPTGQAKGRVPAGRARSVKGISTAVGAGPDHFEWVADPTDSSTGMLHVGDGRIGPVPQAVWEFSVSGYAVLKSWLALRMQRRSGRKSSALDDIRPEQWDAALSQELRELIWVLEATVDAQPALDALFTRVLAGAVVRADELPAPTGAERAAPGEAADAAPQQLEIET